MPQFAAASGAGLLSARPTPGANHEGQLYFGTDTGILYRWDGAAWQNNSLVTAGGDLSGSYPNPEVFQIAHTLQLRQDINTGALNTSQDNFNPSGGSTATVYRIDASAQIEITGLTGGADGRLLILENISAFNIILTNEDASSAAANRFAANHPVVLQPGTSAIAVYDGTSSRWRILSTTTSYLSALTINPPNNTFAMTVGQNFGIYVLPGNLTNISMEGGDGNEAFIINSGDFNCFGNIMATKPGKGFKCAEGSNARMGIATLVAGTVVVNNTSVTADTRIFLTDQGGGVNIGSVGVTARTAGTSFTITSSNPLDTSSVAWLLIEPF